MDAGGLAAAGAGMWDQLLHVEAATVQILFHMGNDHIPLGDFDAVARHQLQFFNEGEIVQTGSGHLASVDFHGVKYGHRSDLAGAGCVPLNVLELAFICLLYTSRCV